MPWTNYYLIRASGFSGVSGQSFLGHVTGAASGVGCKMTDYKLTAVVRDQDPPGAAGSIEYTSPQSWALTFQLVKGDHFHYIQKTTSGRVGSFMSSGGVNIPGSSATLTLISITSTQVAFTLNVASRPAPGAQPGSTISSYSNPGSYGVGKWFANYSYPTLAPSGTAEYIEFFLDTVSIAGTPGGSLVYDVDVGYSPDDGPFNPTYGETYNIWMADRDVNLSDFEVQWSNDGSTVATSGNYHQRLQSLAYENFTVYYRYRYVGGSSYSAWQAVSWVDPRI